MFKGKPVFGARAKQKLGCVYCYVTGGAGMKMASVCFFLRDYRNASHVGGTELLEYESSCSVEDWRSCPFNRSARAREEAAAEKK